MTSVNIVDLFNGSCVLKSADMLNKYISFCIEKNKTQRIQSDRGSETSHHHILPSKLFPDYSDLIVNSWNGVHLLHSDHYYAHWLLTEAVESSSMLFAFCAMHYKDVKLNRITESDLISPEEFQVKMRERSKAISESNKLRAENGTLFNGYVYDIAKSKEKRKKTLLDSPEIVKRMNEAHSVTKQSKEYKETKGIIQKERRRETVSRIENYEANRVAKFKKSFAKTMLTRESILKKFRKDVGLSKLNNIVIYNDRDEQVYCIPYLFSRFCTEYNLPCQSLVKTLKTSTGIYLNPASRVAAVRMNREMYIGWYIKQY